MDTFNFDFDTDSTLTNDTNSNHSNLDWTAFQSAPPPPTITTNNPFSPTWVSQQDDAVAPDNRSNIMTTPHDDGIYFEIERFFNGLNQQQDLQSQGIIDPIHMQMTDQTNHIESSHRVINERSSTCLPAPLVPRLSSSRSQCYHKLPEHAVKLMREWYNANLDDPYPRSPDKKRFITEGNITAQQCRSWFANRRQRLKHVKRNQPRTSLRSHHSIQTRLTQIPSIEQQAKIHEQCYYCQQQQTTAMTTTTTTLNVVINQQTVEQLIHNSLRKLLYPSIM